MKHFTKICLLMLPLGTDTIFPGLATAASFDCSSDGLTVVKMAICANEQTLPARREDHVR